jgi:hypothetical protein
MILWLFFTIFGLVIFIPSTLLILLFNRFKNTIVVLIKQNGALTKIIINNKDLEKGQITEIKGKKINPIPISKEEIYYGKWRRWIIKPELESKSRNKLSDEEIEGYLNNEDLIKLYLAGKFKDTLMLMMGIIIAICIIGFIINGYLTNSHECILKQDNSTKEFIINNMKIALQNI